MTWDKVGVGHTGIWMERWACGHSSEVIHSHTQSNFVQCYVCMYAHTYVRVIASMCVIAYECSNGPATCKQHVTHETTDVGIM